MFEQDRCSGVTKTMSVLTDGQSDNVDSTRRTASNAKDAGIQHNASEIGSGPNEQEL